MTLLILGRSTQLYFRQRQQQSNSPGESMEMSGAGARHEHFWMRSLMQIREQSRHSQIACPSYTIMKKGPTHRRRSKDLLVS